ncbi:hypothetical protein [Corynebacterium sp.]|uniref:hypothetical protein n=1 Tax=Corynebacterium sp. TaxID=1720 RepID=UPI0026DBC6ED|nr:hypothetical protein [Corynebacterium sp.]MDO5077643.1 hypothetical protein [Corynebacterium sp.]
MNTTVLRTAFKVSRAGVRAFNDYRQRKAVEAYDALADAAAATNQFRSTAAERAEEFMDDAGAVTRAARTRLDSALSDAFEDAGAAAQKVISKAQTSLQPVAPESKKTKFCKRLKGTCTKTAKAGVVFAVLAAIAALAFWFFAPIEEPEVTPPRVDDFPDASDEDDRIEEVEESVLVYSTETPVDDADESASSEDSK